MFDSGPIQHFSIKDLEHFSGIKAHTIRIWEQRYALLCPQRSDTNIRYYQNDDLKKLLNVSLLVEQGMRISQIAEMSSEMMMKAVGEQLDDSGNQASVFHSLKLSMLNYDEMLFRQVSTGYMDKHGFKSLVLDIYLPFLSQIGVLWLTDSVCPAQEHFVTNLIRQRIYVEIEAISSPASGSREVVIQFLPEREAHDVSLLFIHYLSLCHGYRSIYLGASIPFKDLLKVAEQFPKARFVSYCTVYPSSANAQAYVDLIDRHFDAKQNRFILAGKVFQDVKGTSVVRTGLDGAGLASELFPK